MKSKLDYVKSNLDMIKNLEKEKAPLIEVARRLGIKYETLKSNLKKLGYEYKLNPHRKGIPHKESRKSALELLNSSCSNSKLREALIRDGIKERRCEHCKKTEWMGKPIPLDLHHKDLNHYNNSLENLQILCKNCHSIAHNYCFNKKLDSKTKTVRNKPKMRQQKPKKIHYCSNCGSEITGYSKSGLCRKCITEKQRKVERPEKKQLLKDFEAIGSFSGLGRKYGITDNAIREWCKSYELPHRTEEFKNYIKNHIKN